MQTTVRGPGHSGTERSAWLIKSKLPDWAVLGEGGTPQRGGLLPRERKGRAEGAERGRRGRCRAGDRPLQRSLLSLSFLGRQRSHQQADLCWFITEQSESATDGPV